MLLAQCSAISKAKLLVAWILSAIYFWSNFAHSKRCWIACHHISVFAIHNSWILGCHCTLSCASGQQLVHIQCGVCWRFTSVAIAVCVLLEGFPMVQYPFWHRLRYAAGWQDQSMLWLCRQTALGPNLQTKRTFLEFYQQSNAVMCRDTFCWVEGATWPIILSKKKKGHKILWPTLLLPG